MTDLNANESPSLPPIYVISLARAAQRRADIVARLNTAGVEYEITEAIDYKTLNMDEHKHRIREDVHIKRYQVGIAPGTIGCVMSHMNLWRRIVTEQTPVALILEDDAIWDSAFFDVVSKVVSSEWDYDIVMLSHVGVSKKLRVLEDLTNTRHLVSYRRSGWITAAYLIRLPGAVKLLPHCQQITSGADALLRENWRTGLRTYNVKPSPVTTPIEGSFSDPTGPRQELTPQQKRQRSRMRAYRRFRRVVYGFTHPPRKRQ